MVLFNKDLPELKEAKEEIVAEIDRLKTLWENYQSQTELHTDTICLPGKLPYSTEMTRHPNFTFNKLWKKTLSHNKRLKKYLERGKVESFPKLIPKYQKLRGKIEKYAKKEMSPSYMSPFSGEQIELEEVRSYAGDLIANLSEKHARRLKYIQELLNSCNRSEEVMTRLLTKPRYLK